MIILLAGLPGTGKTTLARNLASRTGGVVLNKDEMRAALFAPKAIAYTTEQDDLVMTRVLETATSLLHEQPDRMIFLDGRPFARRYQIDQVLQAAAAMKQPWRILLLTCSEETARKRLQEPAGHLAANRSFELYQRVKAGFEAITQPHTVIDTERAEEACLQQAIAALQAKQ
ncbi:MAG TPA: AAA family ATPase [Terriglobales bacterium]|nr:AAA family ATPase [Terriglobales bacterium]